MARGCILVCPHSLSSIKSEAGEAEEALNLAFTWTLAGYAA